MRWLIVKEVDEGEAPWVAGEVTGFLGYTTLFGNPAGEQGVQPDLSGFVLVAEPVAESDAALAAALRAWRAGNDSVAREHRLATRAEAEVDADLDALEHADSLESVTFEALIRAMREAIATGEGMADARARMREFEDSGGLERYLADVDERYAVWAEGEWRDLLEAAGDHDE